MRGHQAIGMHLDPVSFHHLSDIFQELFPVPRAPVYIHSRVSAIHHVIEGTRDAKKHLLLFFERYLNGMALSKLYNLDATPSSLTAFGYHPWIILLFLKKFLEFNANKDYHNTIFVRIIC